MTLPFEGIRIVDFTQIEQGPAGTLVLADFGAEVIKVERIDNGEIGRAGKFPVDGVSCYWASYSRNKKSLSLDLKRPEAKKIIYDLVRVSDIVASNFRPGVMERLGFGYDDLRAVNPRIICAYASGYGQTGPYRDRRGQDLLAQALGGGMALTGFEDGPPTAAGYFIADYLGAMHLAQGMMIALAARERTGEGQVVDTCLLNAMVASHLQEATAYLNTGHAFERPRRPLAHAYQGPLYGAFATADGKWVAFTGGFVDKPWRRVCAALGMPEDVAADPRLQTREGLLEHEAEVVPLVEAAFARFTRDEVLCRLEEQDISCAPVQDYPELFRDPQLLHNEMVVEVEHPNPGAGKIRMPGIPIKLSRTPGQIRLRPPRVGEHNEEILALLGYSPPQIRDLQRRCIVGAENLKRRAGKAEGDEEESAEWREKAPFW